MKASNKQSTRDVVLQTIKSLNQATVDDLAQSAGVSPVTIRHHINSLMSDGLIEAESVRRKVGRPYHVYTLSNAGEELFPKKYFSLSSRLLAELKEQFSPDIVNNLFEGLVQRIVEDHREQFEPLPFEQRLDYLTKLLNDEGFLAHWEKVDGTYRIVEHSCPFNGIGEEHSEICTLDTALITAVMGTEIEQQCCMLDGESSCQFTLKEPSQTIALPEVKVQ